MTAGLPVIESASPKPQAFGTLVLCSSPKSGGGSGPDDFVHSCPISLRCVQAC